MQPLEQREQVLKRRLVMLEAKLHQIDAELVSHNSKDWEELAIEREADEVLEGMGLSGQDEIRAIKAALVRVEAGEYGYCVTCGARVTEERLDVLPQTPFCKKCAANTAAS